MNLVITMSRRFGTGASIIAKELSERLHIPVYDKDDVEHGMRENAFESEADAIRELAKQPCIIIGRCASEFLKDKSNVINIYVCADKEDRIKRIMKLFSLTREAAEVMLEETDKQRVGLAQALVGNPKVLILDEPTVGLDPKQIIEIRTLIKKLGKNHTVILSSHILSEVQAVCDKIVVIDKGKLVANDTAENLSHNLSADHKLTVQIEGPTKEVKSLLEQIPQMVEVHLNRTIDKTIGEYELNAQEGCDIRREVFKRMAARNYPILLMRSSELTLEEIFLKLTTGDFYGNIDNGGAAR